MLGRHTVPTSVLPPMSLLRFLVSSIRPDKFQYSISSRPRSLPSESFPIHRLPVIISQRALIWTGFGMEIRFLGTFILNIWLHFTDDCYTQTSVLSHDLHESSGNGFQRWTFAFFSVPELFPCLSYNNSRLSTTCLHWSFKKQRFKQFFHCYIRRLTMAPVLLNIYEAVAYQWLLFCWLFLCWCPETGLHVTIFFGAM
jgi:hypothetical protein